MNPGIGVIECMKCGRYVSETCCLEKRISDLESKLKIADDEIERLRKTFREFADVIQIGKQERISDLEQRLAIATDTLDNIKDVNCDCEYAPSHWETCVVEIVDKTLAKVRE